MSHKIIIAIDGFSSCGKSTLARDLSQKLGYRYIDTGAMYRAVTYYFYMNRVNMESHKDMVAALEHIHIDFDYDSETGNQITILNGQDVQRDIRSKEISDKVSPVSTIKEVRHHLVKLQQKMGQKKGLIMDGRDIGTVVFPHAELKLFLTADEDTRVKRRLDELNKDGNITSAEEVRENLRKRDYIDSHREESPLRQAEDAIVLDNTNLTMQGQLELAYKLAMEAVSAHKEQGAVNN